MKTLVKVTAFLLIGLVSGYVSAKEDESIDEAIMQTQKDLVRPEFRNSAVKEFEGADRVDSHVKDLSGSDANERAIYELAAEVLGNMKGKSFEQVVKEIENAKSNPEGFANSWTPAQKAKLKALSERMPANKYQKP